LFYSKKERDEWLKGEEVDSPYVREAVSSKTSNKLRNTWTHHR
jgi:hypothetical protein